MKDKPLRTYMADHHAGSVAAVEQIKHYLKTHEGSPRAAFLREILGEIEEDRATLLDLLQRVGGSESAIKDAAAWVMDKLSRAKLNEVAKNRELSELEKLDELVLGVGGKLALWKALHAVTQSDDRFRDVDFGRLERRATDQIDRLEHHRLAAARSAFLEDVEGQAASEE